jgi:hypothetical protein
MSMAYHHRIRKHLSAILILSNMKISFLLSTLLFLINQVAAWHGSMAASGYYDPGNGIRQLIYLTDYTTGSTWQATLFGGFNACTSNNCAVL